ncbi:aminotransferase class I/II-fold pyridoxal phosphate-dependent enzyme [Hydrogenophaga sp.]|uniref:aminotransferase class I/II-fold pyridoxal phosphate-dependent enzyme n=1 Tax=Hydrogenophaga sp. TaxID=1904254 RepID=UPI0027376035|nr:aminotransferase class I/II-fold pyridoxal phosphate-dependent enzyme [Hydrogenophaga sp.]MDP3323663.1 aminotransferase class I/II-fold pyridoxal phosphate-dependent enzyme [Hydrogenophaga sp.]MDP3883460.1 aminotransferase class I/II-fold pyridoxal phosphate-dependent enzyme [Hydrogenophaga sp.]
MNARVHGGPDALGVPRFDFSTNSNACGPCPEALAAVRQADARCYPDASYSALRQQLAAFHGVEPQRVLLAGSASEFIFRITACVAQQGAHQVCLPPHAYGDYAQAARAWGLSAQATPHTAQLVWACEPSSPLGGPHQAWPAWPPRAPLVLDRAYEPLRLRGAAALTAGQLEQVWQLWTPNKALGLTGVRAAYVIAPQGAPAMVAALERLCPSWPVGAHGVAMLQAWVQPTAQAWLTESLHTLREWKARQMALLQELGWDCLPSDTSFFCARPAANCDLARLRAAGIKLRDATSFGLPGHVRVSVQPPASQDALKAALRALLDRSPPSDARERQEEKT